jgi:adenylosuccinate lyase
MAENSAYDTYTSPLASRNASKEMLRLWSARHKFNTWRRIWLAVAEAQHEMGLPVSKEQVEELRAVVNRRGGITDEEMKAAEKYERELRHDVMAHVHALGDSCPKAKGIVHLGMTSQDVNDNAELRILDSSLRFVIEKTTYSVNALAQQAERFKHLPTLAFTHYQAAQPLTVGRRFAQWSYELSLSSDMLSKAWMFVVERRRGLRGATGTQASYLSLFGDDSRAVDELESRMYYGLEEHPPYPSGTPGFAEKITLAHTYALVTQTYPRVIDAFILASLASVASVLHKIATDIRLLCNRKEIDEPFEEKQIGSSAMPYKRNPMRCERICGLSRFVMNLVGNAYDTAATQWLERTLDDSSNRRLSLPEAFLALDGALDLMHNVASGLIVHEATVKKNLMAELPFMATENILMACVKLGADRQEYHERIRVHAQAAGLRVKQEGLDNDLLERLRNDPAFKSKSQGGTLSGELDWAGVMDPMKYVGRSVEQTERFIEQVVKPLREQYGEAIAKLGGDGPRV